ncbi:MAG: hypothetical protein EA397_17960 [Deltaproteobacteria bacterium]|nr:MAG: hypothetical protein EA397_17960 [Deltaproteobacteria bacterium]
MRPLTLLLLLTACDSEGVELVHHSTMLNATRGVVLLGEGAGHGAMLDTTCSFNALEGHVIRDVDLPTPVERVGGGSGEWVFGYSPEGVHTIRFDDWQHERDLALPGVLHASGTHRRTVWIRDDGQGCLFGEQTHLTHRLTELELGACSEQARLLTWHERDRVWLVDQGRIIELSEGEQSQSFPGDLATLDPRSGALYAATGTTLSRHSLLGGLSWSIELDRPIHSITNLGARNGVAAVIEDRGLLLINRQGKTIGSMRLPGQAEAVSSETDDDLALVTDQEVHFYTLVDQADRRAERATRAIEFVD